MSVPEYITQFLDERQVKYSIDHHTRSYSSHALAQSEGISGYKIAKTVVCMVDDEPLLLVLAAPLQVSMEAVSDELGADAVRLAEPAEIAELFPEWLNDVAPPPLPLWTNVNIHVDNGLLDTDEVVFAAGSAQDAIRMSMATWRQIAEPSIGKFAVPETLGHDVSFEVSAPQ